ncbi:MAG: LysE family translocator [Cellulomonadaceae bacterium]|nr:LysE family translocator [Cellulomonadaceae bacterium]
MPSLHTLALFAVASVALIAAPGPAVTFILTTTLRRGRGAGLAATAGVEVGNMVHVVAAAFGVSAIVAASAEAFTAIKVAGAAWLLWLAVKAWLARTPGTLAGVGGAGVGGAASGSDGGTSAQAGPPAGGEPVRWLAGIRAGFLVGALNPKTALFFLAFLPQFVRPDAGAAWSQMLVLGLVFVGLACVGDSMWAFGGGALRQALPKVRMLVLDRISASVYAALGLVTLAARRAI